MARVERLLGSKIWVVPTDTCSWYRGEALGVQTRDRGMIEPSLRTCRSLAQVPAENVMESH